MSYDQLSTFRVIDGDPLDNLIRPGTRIQDASAQTIKAAGDVMGDDLLLEQDGALGWDMPSYFNRSRRLAQAQGAKITSSRTDLTKFRFTVSQRISTAGRAKSNALKEQLNLPRRKIIQAEHIDMPGQTDLPTRYRIGARYAGGLNVRTRHVAGRVMFPVSFDCPWGYWVRPVLRTAATTNTFTPEGQGECIWGVAAVAGTSTLGVTMSVNGVSRTWNWAWDRSGVDEPPIGAFSSAPDVVTVCFSSPVRWGVGREPSTDFDG